MPENTTPTLEELQEVTRQANEGDKVALQRLRVILNNNPQIWSQMGDVAEYAVLAIVRLISAGDALRQEATLRKAKQMEKELAGASPTPTERLVVQSVVLSWLQTMYVDTIHPVPDGASLQQLRFRLQLKDSASRRYQALKTLATIRRLLPAASSGAGSCHGIRTWSPHTPSIP